MRIGNRLFPYPTLNNDSNLTEYEAISEFQLCFDTDEEGMLPGNKDGQILRNTYFRLTDPGLLSLYNSGKVKCGLVVESSASVFRKMYELSESPQNVMLRYVDLKGTVQVSAYLYATEDINGYTNENFNINYRPYSFDIEKYDILAVDDGFRFQVNIDPTFDNKVPSIFTIVRKSTQEKQMEYNVTQNNIIIALPDEYYNRYDNIKGKANFNNMMFAMIAIPALAGAISDVKKLHEDDQPLDDIIESYRWFRSILASYKKVTNSELTGDDLQSIDPVVLAQIVLNDATCNGIEEISEYLLRGKDREEEFDDE